MKRLFCLILFLVFLPICSFADDPVSGKWSFYWDARMDNFEESLGMSIISIDLILFENHFASLIMAHIGPGDNNFVIDDPITRGTWSSNGDNTYILLMGIDDPVHSMTLNEDGLLYVQLSEHSIFPFTKTQNYSMSEVLP